MKTKDFSMCGEIRKILTIEWQTSAQLASQIVIPPEKIGRAIELRKKVKGHGYTLDTARAHVIAQAMSCLVRYGVAEKRKMQGGHKNEYRLNQNKATQ
jgi:hypothetical protein